MSGDNHVSEQALARAHGHAPRARHNQSENYLSLGKALAIAEDQQRLKEEAQACVSKADEYVEGHWSEELSTGSVLSTLDEFSHIA